MTKQEETNLYMKRPIPCEAIQYLSGGPDVRGVCTGECRGPEYHRECAPHIHGLEGDHSVSEGDWIVKGVKGEFWAVKDEIFRETYRPYGEKGKAIEGRLIVKAWKAWKDSGDGRTALSPYTLSVNSTLSHEYLENRLELAFQAGVKAAEEALKLRMIANSERGKAQSGVLT